jgi:ketosteroid isomerase-like protein
MSHVETARTGKSRRRAMSGQMPAHMYSHRMRRATSLLLALAPIACSPAASQFEPGDRAAIETLLADQAAAWNRGDLDGFMAGYERSEQLVFTSGAQIRRGWQTTHDRFQERYGAGAKSDMGKLAFEIVDVRPLGADGAIVLGQWDLTETPQAGRGVFSLAALRTGEGWRIVHDHTSAETHE